MTDETEARKHIRALIVWSERYSALTMHAPSRNRCDDDASAAQAYLDATAPPPVQSGVCDKCGNVMAHGGLVCPHCGDSKCSRALSADEPAVLTVGGGGDRAYTWGRQIATLRSQLAKQSEEMAELRGELSQIANAGGDCIDRIAQLEGELAGMRRAVLEEVIDAIHAQALTDETGEADDAAYNRAIRDAEEAVGDLIDPKTGEG